MKNLSGVCFILSLMGSLSAQSLTWSEDIASIIYDKCTSCHHDGGVAPFSLESYPEVVARGSIISQVINQGEMPPWPPDNDFSQFTHDRSLTQQEIDDLTLWINTGAALGDTTLAPCPPDYSPGTYLGTPDLKLTIPHYRSKATSSRDDYVCFSLPTGLTSDRYVEAVEIVAGNPEIVHHVIIYVDPSGTYPTDTVGGNCMGPSTSGVLGAYAPGSLPTIYPNGGGTATMGVKVPAGANIILAMHYPEGSAGELDSTSVHLFFYPVGTGSVREISVAPVALDLSFCIPPNQIYTLSENNNVPVDLSVLSVFPHMHLLGASIISYAVTPQNDTINLINIPHWDFEWQDFYYFKNILKIPAGSVVYSEATYDNTTNNPHNPFSPPQTVCGGLNTTDEMFIVSLQVTPYISGDENISLEDLLAAPKPTISADGPTSLCTGNTVTLNADAGYNAYLWCPTGDTTQSIIVSQPGAYYVEVKDAKGVSGNSNVIIIDNNGGPPVSVSPVSAGICRGNSVTINASGGVTYDWNSGDNTASISVSPTSTTGYRVTVTDANGCTGLDSATVIVYDNPQVSISDVSFCEGEPAILDAGNSGSNYQWSTGDTTQLISVSQGGIYHVTVVDGNHCSGTDTAQAIKYDLPVIDLGPDTTICKDASVMLDVSAGYSYHWSTGDTTTGINVSPSGDQLYSVTVTDANGCTNVDSLLVAVTVCSGIELFAAYLEIFPNPASTAIHIRAKTGELNGVVISLFDMRGKAVYEHPIKNRTGNFQEAIDVSKLAKGLYFLQVKNEQSKMVKKIVVQ